MSMSVSELIDKLKEFDGNLEVAVNNNYGFLGAVDDVSEGDMPEDMSYSDETEQCVIIT